MCALRWRFLVRTQNVFLNVWQSFRLTYIGSFFNVVLPGSVSGDIVKAYYLTKERGKKGALVSTVVIDRILGLYTLTLAGCVALLIGLIEFSITGNAGVWSKSYMQALGAIMLILFATLTLFCSVLLTSKVKESTLIKNIIIKIPYKIVANKIYEIIKNYKINKQQTSNAIILSFSAQIPLYLGLICFASSLEIEALNVLVYIIALPVCLVINAIPLGPGGLGIGEVGFEAVFLIFGSSEGAELAMLFHLVVLIQAISIGSVVYFLPEEL